MAGCFDGDGMKKLEKLLKRESQLPPRLVNYNPELRTRGLRKIELIWSHPHSDGISSCWFPYVAMNLFDRLAPLIKDKEVDSIVVSCLTLACKMQIRKFDTTRFLLERGLTQSLGDVVRTELRILRLLEWKTQQLTPFCFVSCFSSMLPASCNFRLALQIIVWTQADISFAKFSPSTIATSAMFCILTHDYAKILAEAFIKLNFQDHHRDTIVECTAMMKRIYQVKLSSQISETTEVEEMDQMSSEDRAGGCMHIWFQKTLEFICFQAAPPSESATMNEPLLQP